MRKQFVWLMTDTTRYDMIGCYKFPQMRTPNIDKMAEEGIRFDAAYCCQPVCGPSRSALFTGLYPHTNGMWANSMSMYDNVKTLGQWLMEAYIPCGYIGKWHLDEGDYFGKGVAPDGWDKDTWYDMRNYLDELSDTQKVRLRKPKTAGKVPENMTFAYRCTKRALEYIEKHKDEDFFLVVSFDEPHGPSVCPEPYASMDIDYEIFRSPAYQDTMENKPEYQKIWAGTNVLGKGEGNNIRPYGLVECNSYVDSQFGKILDKMKEITPDAMVVFTSDHGDALKAHNLSGKGNSVYDEIARIPLIFKGPMVRKGKVYSHVASHIDVMPTVLDYMTGSIPDVLQGKSMLSILKDEKQEEEKPVFIEFGRFCCRSDQFGGFQPMRAVITDQFKLSLHMTGEGEMYHVQKDPDNLINIFNEPQYKQEKEYLIDLVLGWMRNTKDPFYGQYFSGYKDYR